jgi:hypothetical protein
MISMLTLAALLATSSAFAADATATSSKPTTHAAKSDHHCRDQAKEQKLTGAERKSFVKKCMADAKAGN